MDPKSRWYYENHGKAEGPVSTLDLVKKIQEGELKLIDLVFKEGDGQWMPAEHFSEITSLTKTATTDFKVDADWIVLRTIEIDGRNQYDQIGPFTIDQVLQLIDKGKVKFTDFVWRNGYENWVPLGHLDKYENPLESSVRVDLSIYEKPRTEELTSTAKPAKFFKPAQKVKPASEAKPPEAEGEDLAKEKWHIEIPQKTKTMEPPPKAVVEEIKAAEPVRRRRKEDQEVPVAEGAKEPVDAKKQERLNVAKQRWSAVASAVAVFIFLCGATLFVFFGQKVYRTHQAKNLKMSFEPIATVKQKPRKVEPEVVKNIQPPVVQKPIVAEPPVAPVEVKKVSEFAQMTTKQKSYYYNSERLFLFYKSQKGLSLVSEIDKILKPTKSKKKPNLKNQIEAWAAKVQTHQQAVLAEGRGEKLYSELHKRLVTVTQELFERSQDLRSQAMNGRGPSKEWTLQEVSVEYKKLLKLAQDLD